MKKSQSIFILVGIVLLIVGTLIVKKVHEDNVASKAQSSYPVINACSLLTKAKAQQLLGPYAAPTSSSGIGSGSSSVYVSLCSYSDGGHETPTSLDIVSVLVRSAKDQAGKNSNELLFTTEKPKGAITIKGYSSDAIWDESNGQLDVLYKYDTIYITARNIAPNGKNIEYAQNSLSNAETVAKLVIPKN